jgi:2-methylcitrate dehydratase PrpD
MAVYLVDDPEPFNKGFIGSRYSIQFSLALALIAGEAGMNKALFDQKYTQAMLLDPQIKAVMTKVSVKNDSELAREWPNKWPVKIKITQKDGNIYEKFIEYPLGEPENPMLDAQLVEKFNRASSGYLSPDEATELRQMIDNFEALVDVGAVLKLVSGKYQRGEV